MVHLVDPVLLCLGRYPSLGGQVSQVIRPGVVRI